MNKDLDKKRLIMWTLDSKVTRISIYTEMKTYHVYKKLNILDVIDDRGRDISYTDPVILIGDDLLIASKLEDVEIRHRIRWDEIDNIGMKMEE